MYINVMRRKKKCPICKGILSIIILSVPEEERYYCKKCNYCIYKIFGKIEFIVGEWHKTIDTFNNIEKAKRLKNNILSDTKPMTVKEVMIAFGLQIKKEIKKREIMNFIKN